MESVLSSDDSSDSIQALRNQLTEYGWQEENLSKQEMVDVLQVLSDSKSTAKKDDLKRQKVEEPEGNSSRQVCLKRKNLNVRDRRLPWSLFPANITSAEKARTLAVFFKEMSMTVYRQARLSINMSTWPPPLEIVEETTRIQPIRSTRSGRAFPIYVGLDEDSSDIDVVVTKSKKRKDSNSENNANGAHSKKVISLKRKSVKDENNRSAKLMKTTNEITRAEFDNPSPTSVFELIQD